MQRGLGRQQEQMAGALEAALKGTLQTHSQMFAGLEKQSMEQSARLFEQLGALASVVRDYGHDQQAALVRVGERLAAQVAALGGLQQGEQHLLQLQAGLQQNLAALAGAGTFEQTLHTLDGGYPSADGASRCLAARPTVPPHRGFNPGKAA